MSLVTLTLKSMLSRKLTTSLLIVAIALSSMLLVGVQKIKVGAKESFSHSISGTDLIVGSRSGDIQLLLYMVFRKGQPVANMSWESVKDIQNFSEVKWVVPVSLGDSHMGYPVLATNEDYFKQYRYGRKMALAFIEGQKFQDVYEVVLGAEVARALKYELGKTLYLSHDVAKGNLPIHKNTPFKVVGILEPTGTPVDKTVHITLEGMTAIHVHPSKRDGDLTPSSITGCFVGLKSKFSIFSVQRRITDWSEEPLMAIIPGVSLSRLWGIISSVETAFLVVTILVTAITLIGLLLALFMSLQQRKRELAILRTMGAHPSQLFTVLILESLFVTVSGVLLGLGLTFVVGGLLSQFLAENMGLVLALNSLSLTEIYFAVGIVVSGLITSSVPAFLAYRKGISEGFVSL